MAESHYWDNSAFITLTYSDEFLPKDKSLHPETLKQFWKDLRQDLHGRQIKYFACGEYGDKGRCYNDFDVIHRPHYHAIVYGIDADNDEDREIIADNWPWCERFMFKSKPGHKNDAIAYAEPDSMQYVAGYCQKKLYGEKKVEEFDNKGLVMPFSRSSKGIGEQFAREHESQIRSLGGCYWKGQLRTIPRYYRKKLGSDALNPADGDKRKRLNIDGFSQYEEELRRCRDSLDMRYGNNFHLSRTGQRMIKMQMADWEQSVALEYERKFKEYHS